MVKVLFVCTGNICRSPTAEGVFRHLTAQAGLGTRIEADSAATHAYHVGEPPDPRTQAAARQRGINLASLRARKVEPDDFRRFDYLVAMDNGHHRILSKLAPPGQEHRVIRLLDFAPHLDVSEVPDPYYGGRDGFDRVFDIIEEGAKGLLAHIRTRF